MYQIKTIGHASILLTNDKNEPLLLTDPWLVGSCYWRSWWLQNYPTDEELNSLSKVKYCYVTHEHPDHYHYPSIRRLGKDINYLSPDIPDGSIVKFLSGEGFKANNLTPLKWYAVDENVSILSIPLYNDDSCLLINTPTAFIINLNDSKPTSTQLKKISEHIQDVEKNKKVILLSSYSPASIVNSFRKDANYVSIKDKKDYVKYLVGINKVLKTDYFIPFASQVIFYRPDSVWANEYKVTIDDLKEGWGDCTTQLLNPYSTINLSDFTCSYVPRENYNHTPSVIQDKVDKHIESEKAVVLSKEDLANIEKKMRFHRFFFIPLFPHGIGFETETNSLFFSPWKGRLIEKDPNTKPNFTLRIPNQALRDAAQFGHFGDLGITMFTIIILNRNTNPKLIYVFFVLLMLHDYKHTISLKNFSAWIKSVWKFKDWKIPALNTRVQIA